MKLIPLFSRIKVLADENKTVTKSGIFLPDEQKQKRTSTGVIISVGETVECLKEGEKILFGEYAGFPRREDEDGNEVLTDKEGKIFRYMNEEDVVARYEE